MRAIVTGAASGIGFATARRFARDSLEREGAPAKLVLVDIDGEKLDKAAEEVRAEGANVRVLSADLADPAAPAAVIEAAEKAYGGLDVLVSNAGLLLGASLAELELEDYDRLFAVNTRATWLLAKAAYPLLKQSRGCIVATASISAEEPTPPFAVYSATKAALVLLIRQLAYEWGPDGIRCNCISPAVTHTGMSNPVFSDPAKRADREARIPLRRIGLPEDQAAAISFLASREAAFITGVNLPVEGGIQTALMPSLFANLHEQVQR